MKKNKNELILIVSIVIVGILSFYFYRQSQNIVTVDEIKYTENGGVNYKVHLMDKKYYNKDYLDEGMQYISSIVDYIDLSYRYDASFDTKDTFKVAKTVTANVKIVDGDNEDNVIYQKSEILKNDSTSGDKIGINDSIKLDYRKYNNLTNDFKSSYGISAKCTLTVDYKIDYYGANSNIKQSKVLKVTIPLSEQMIKIQKSEGISNSSSYVGETKDSLINRIMFALAILFLILSVVGIVLLLIAIKNRIARESKYDRYITKILKENDSYITIAKENFEYNGKNIIKIDSFKELLDVRNNIDKPIVYTKVNENESKFIILDNEVYEYTVKREEMDI